MTFRIINTAVATNTGPNGIRYVHDAARPFAVLRAIGHGEICIGRYSAEKKARRAIAERTSFKYGE